ncbi:hypothetical protein ES705_48751 [subsurface metagenome]
MQRKITISMPDWVLAEIEESRAKSGVRVGILTNRSVYVRWLIYHGLKKAAKLNGEEVS